jgi:hypothetical protein
MVVVEYVKERWNHLTTFRIRDAKRFRTKYVLINHCASLAFVAIIYLLQSLINRVCGTLQRAIWIWFAGA